MATSTYEQIYNAAPWPMKELLVALEAYRRSRYRRYGDAAAVRAAFRFSHYQRLSLEQIRAEQLGRLRALVKAAREGTEYYKTLPEVIDSLDDLADLPILTKADLRSCSALMIAQGTPPKHLWSGLTSGSTGTPLRLYVGREGIRARFAIQDEYYALFGCHYGDRRARFGGSKIKLTEQREPPFWIMNRFDHQLQMSPYHMFPDVLPLYVQQLNEFKPIYLTGYAHALYILGEHIASAGGLKTTIRAVFTDSEGVPPHFIPIIEMGFGAPVYDVYGLGEVGWVAVQCTQKRYHLLERSCITEIVDDDGRPVPDGEPGRILVTDLTQSAVPYIRYDTGDIGRLSNSAVCPCGWNTRILEGIDGRADDLLITPSGRKVGRLSHVSKPGRGILESQIVQTAPDRVIIRVVPLPDFDAASMEDVVATARHLIGEDVTIAWEVVDSIPRTNRHKFKHVVREFEG